MTGVVDENSYPHSDDSPVEDVENDPDWTRTPLYNRIQSLLVIRVDERLPIPI